MNRVGFVSVGSKSNGLEKCYLFPELGGGKGPWWPRGRLYTKVLHQASITLSILRGSRSLLAASLIIFCFPG